MVGNCLKIAVSIIWPIWTLNYNSIKLQCYSNTITWLPIIPKLLCPPLISSFATVINVVLISVHKHGFWFMKLIPNNSLTASVWQYNTFHSCCEHTIFKLHSKHNYFLISFVYWFDQIPFFLFTYSVKIKWGMYLRHVNAHSGTLWTAAGMQCFHSEICANEVSVIMPCPPRTLSEPLGFILLKASWKFMRTWRLILCTDEAKLKNNCITCHTAWYCDLPTATGMAKKELLKMPICAFANF